MALRKHTKSYRNVADIIDIIEEVKRLALKPVGFLDKKEDIEAAVLCFQSLQIIYNAKCDKGLPSAKCIERFMDERATQILKIHKLRAPFILHGMDGKLVSLPEAFGRYLWLDRQAWLQEVEMGVHDLTYRTMLGRRTLRSESGEAQPCLAICDIAEREVETSKAVDERIARALEQSAAEIEAMQIAEVAKKAPAARRARARSL